MDYFEIAAQITELMKDKSVFLKTTPEILDFTSGAMGKLEIWNSTRKIELEILPSTIRHLAGLLETSVFDRDQVERLYTWNFKSLASYARYFGSKFLSPRNNFIDLRPLEYFLNIRRKAPENLIEAVNRVKALVADQTNWQSAQRIYKDVHLPLTLRVLPTLETTPLLNEVSRRPEYPYYDIEGQVNGRLNCAKAFAQSYLPHILGPDARHALKPRGIGIRFVTADFRHCEVNVLQWLSGDEVLKEIIDSGEDLHKRIYEIITDDVCNTDIKRNKSKSLFLPVMYGCSPKGVASNLSVSEAVGRELHSRIEKKFATATAWMRELQERAKREVIRDYFGRPRKFKEEESHLARNFTVQAAAATVCQEKLIVLYKALEGTPACLAFSVHDGYGMLTEVAAAEDTYKIIKNTLESESKLCPGLKMKVEVKFGAKLGAMKVLWKN